MPRTRDLILAIETSNPSAWTEDSPSRPGVAVGRLHDGNLSVLAVESIDPRRPHDDTLLAACDVSVRRAGGSVQDLAVVAVSAGPGGYTAVRLAITAAKMIAEATGARCIAVPTARVVARRAPDADARTYLLLASKNETAWAVRLDGRRGVADDGQIADVHAIQQLNPSCIIADRFVPQPILQWANDRQVRIVRPVFDPAACAEAALDMPSVEPSMLAPIYPREPEAVTLWMKKHGPKP